MKFIAEACDAQLIRYLRIYYYHWVDTSAGGVSIPDGIICPWFTVPK